ncbi:O-fucosyltransferase family protein [Niallia sp. 01092]|uniref:O-fucosyltransferase family protein n=1 Tax=unclassified Niallia TaxID=2837522 RepID=UPI003FD2DDCC
MSKDKFLLIKTWGWGFWSDMDHLVGQLLVAELTNRIPVVYWGPHSLYSEYIDTNAFELYYEPVSDYSLHDVIRPEHTFFPPIWNDKNVLVEDLDKTARLYRSLGDLMGSKADVVVSDVHFYSQPILPYIKKNHWAYGMTAIQIYRILIEKYLKLKPDILEEIDEFHRAHFLDEKPILGIHVRASDKVREVENLAKLNKQYDAEIERVLEQNDIKKIFLITDSEDMIEKYEQKYGSNVFYTECTRSSSYSKDDAPHLQNYIIKRRKGIEIIKDTYLAAKCDFFIGNGYSNVSFFVNRLKDWREYNITLFYRTLKEDKKSTNKRGMADWATKYYRAKEHKAEYPSLYGGE